MVATWSDNVGNHSAADLEMERVANQGRVKDPVYHLILSWRSGEDVPLDVARHSIDATLRSMGAEDHQWYAALHHDEDDGRTHLHVAVNKVHPITLKALNRWQDRPKLARAAEWIEREFGCRMDRHMPWREYLPEVDLGFSIDAAEENIHQVLASRLHAEPPGAQQKEMDAVRRAGYSWATLLQREAAPAALAAIAHDKATWNDLHAALETYHVHLERAGSGLRVVGFEEGQHLKASRLGLRFRELETKLGPYQESPHVLSNWPQRTEQAKAILAAAGSWADLHESLATVNLAIERRGRGGRLRDLAGVGGSVPLSRLKTSMPKLLKRFGPYQIAEVLSEKEKEEKQRRHAGIEERLQVLSEDPSALLGRITAHHAVWQVADVELEIARVVGIEHEELAEKHETSLCTVRDSVLELSVEIEPERRIRFDSDGQEIIEEEKRYSTAAVIEMERRAFEAVRTIAERRRELRLRAPSKELDEQQQLAYAHLIDGASDLRVVTGIAGAGKSRLLREVCAAYSEAGYQVVGTAVAGSAARVLGEEAQIQANTLARLRIDLQKGKRKLTDRSVIVVDEASMIGTDDARQLFEAASTAGTRVLLLGDIQQHEAVARGPVLQEIVERHAASDLHTTRRAQEQWLRDVGMDLRAGRTGRALDTLRERSCIAEHETSKAAMSTIVGRYVADVREGRSALLIATKRADVLGLNQRAREELRDRLGEEREYTTAFGKRMMAVGDKVITREPHQRSGTVNGDTWVVAGHKGDAHLEMVRDRDGARVVWDVRERPAVDYGYAITSYRSQGQTVDGAYVLASSADAQRGLYVNITRARKNVLIAYGREELDDFGALLNVGARDRSKLTVAAVEREAAARQLREEAVNSPHPKTSKVTDAEAHVIKRSETFVQSMRMTMNRPEPGQQIEGILAWKEKIPGTGSSVVLVKDSQGVAWRSTVQVENGLRYGDRMTLHAGLGENDAKLVPQQNRPQLKFRL